MHNKTRGGEGKACVYARKTDETGSKWIRSCNCNYRNNKKYTRWDEKQVNMEFQSYKYERTTHLTSVRPYSVHCLGTIHSLQFSTFLSLSVSYFANGITTLRWQHSRSHLCFIVCASPNRLLTYSGNCFVLYWKKFSCHKLLFSDKQTSATNLYILAPEGKTKNVVCPTALQWHSSKNIILKFCNIPSYLPTCRTRHCMHSRCCPLFLARLCVFRKYWTVLWVTWNTFYIDKRPQIIQSFYVT